jgi:hypothetical protein
MILSNKRSFCLAVFIGLFLFLSILNPNPLSFQEKKDETTLQHEVTVTLKLIQVYVTDKKGDPVVDLMRLQLHSN